MTGMNYKPFSGQDICDLVVFFSTYIFNRKCIKKRSRIKISILDRFLLDFSIILVPKSLQNRSQSGLGRALNGDNVSKLKK